MSLDVMINRLAYATGKSRKEVIQALRQMSAVPEIQKELKKHGKKK